MKILQKKKDDDIHRHQLIVIKTIKYRFHDMIQDKITFLDTILIPVVLYDSESEI